MKKFLIMMAGSAMLLAACGGGDDAGEEGEETAGVHTMQKQLQAYMNQTVYLAMVTKVQVHQVLKSLVWMLTLYLQRSKKVLEECQLIS